MTVGIVSLSALYSQQLIPTKLRVDNTSIVPTHKKMDALLDKARDIWEGEIVSPHVLQ